METDGTSPFDAIRHEDGAGNEYWSARELAKVLGYTTNFRNFQPVIAKAETSCESSGYATSDHFAHVRTMIGTGKGAQRAAEDVHLSRYACYLVVMNGDPDKPIIAAGQTYFAEQTRRQELADEAALPGLSEAQRRLFVRKQLRDHNKQLAEAANAAGVITPRDFALFQDHGYRGLYAGETARLIAERKGVKPGQILEYMGSTELAANLFRATQTEEKLQREGINDKDLANRTHHVVGAAVRRTIAELGGTMPEDLPTPEQSIQQLQRAEQKRLEAERQPSLFDLPSDSDGADE
jgi:DNA-damage-inducible protein D